MSKKRHAAFTTRDQKKHLLRKLRKPQLPCEFCGKDVDGNEPAVQNTETRQFAHRRCAEEHVAKQSKEA